MNIFSNNSEYASHNFIVRMLLEAITHHFPIEDVVSGVGALHYKSEERKILASVTPKWKCDKCGILADIFNSKFRKEEIKIVQDKIEET